MAGLIRAFPPRLLFPRPVITEITLEPFLDGLSFGSRNKAHGLILIVPSYDNNIPINSKLQHPPGHTPRG